MPIGNDFISADAIFLQYFPEEILPSTGLRASSGICQIPFTFIAPEIFPLLHISFTERYDTPHSTAFSLQVFIRIISIRSISVSLTANYISEFAVYQSYFGILRITQFLTLYNFFNLIVKESAAFWQPNNFVNVNLQAL